MNPQIVEPQLQFSNLESTLISDGGNLLTIEVLIQSLNILTNVFRFRLSFQYLTQFFYFNESSVNSTILYYDSVQMVNYTLNVSVDNPIGSVLFGLDEIESTASVITAVQLILTNNIRSSSSYILTYEVDWNSLSYGLEGGRSYNYTATIRVPTPDISLFLSYLTSDPFTTDPDIQVQEVVSINITILFPEVRLCKKQETLLMSMFTGNI